MAGCASCGRGFHKLCLKRSCEKCHPAPVANPLETTHVEGIITGKKELKDEKSTGRKRAAKLYPIDPLADCEWKMQVNCGGGRRPIIGCIDGKQRHRHHGPVKKTTQNREGNVHRICEACHVRWHELNDLIYQEGDYNLLPHAPEQGSLDAVILNDTEWRAGVMKTRFQLASSVKGKLNLKDEED